MERRCGSRQQACILRGIRFSCKKEKLTHHTNKYKIITAIKRKAKRERYMVGYQHCQG